MNLFKALMGEPDEDDKPDDPSVVEQLPTDRQLEYAKQLGIRIPPYITRGDLSFWISERLKEKEQKEESERHEAWLREIDTYVWSVVRDQAKAKWHFYRESGVNPESIRAVTMLIDEQTKTDDRLYESISDQISEGCNGENNADPEREEDEWVLFGRGQASRRSKAYKTVASMMNIRIV